MTIDYTAMATHGEVKAKHIVEQQHVTFDVLRAEVNRLYDTIRAIVDDLTDADIAFIPHDPHAHDAAAINEEEQHIGWSLGHLVAHVTATNEEGAVFASLLARGIPQGGRIRTEVPWREVDTVAKAVQRLEESRRIVLAYLSAIPDEPDLTTERPFSEKALAFFGQQNALAAMVQGLAHHAEHIAQFEEVRAQAIAAKDRL